MKSPVYHSLNMRLKIGPADRGMFVIAVISFPEAMLIFHSAFAGLCAFCALYTLAVVLGSRDPNWLLYFVHNVRKKAYAYYDPAR